MKPFQSCAFIICFLAVGLPLSQGFVTTSTSRRGSIARYNPILPPPGQALQTRSAFNNNEDKDKRKDIDGVNVNIIPDVDALTLTAVGFGLIAFNFFVLANLGDGGLAGTVAKIINLMKE